MITFLELEKLGRLGNQLWQIASTIGIAKYNSAEYAFPEWSYQKYFENPLPVLPYKMGAEKFETQLEKHHHFCEYPLDPMFNYSLHGFFQSDKYFDKHRELVLNYFKFKNEITDKVYRRISDATKGDIELNVVAIHVRRKDYVTQKQNFEYLGIEYYGKAISHFREKYNSKVLFIVCSDDTNSISADFGAWFHSSDFYYSKDFNEVEDLCLLSMCDDIICANSSFSSWAAILGDNPNKQIIQPKKWFGTHLAKTHKTNDMYFEKSILI